MKFIYENHFSKIYPKVSFFYYVIVSIMLFALTSPVFLIMNILSFILYLFLLTDVKGTVKKMFYLIPMMLFITLLNPLFNHNGQTPLLYINDKPFTLEALLYGALTGALILSMFLLFATMCENINSDKIIFIFSKHFPYLSLMISMIFKVSSDLKKQLNEISMVQQSMGVSTKSGKLKARLESGTSILSCLFSVGLENSLDTAISMKSRGFGVVKKTTFHLYKFKKNDLFLSCFIIINVIFVIAFYFAGDFQFIVFPKMSKLNFEINNVLCYIIYGIFINIPLLFNIKEDIKWHFLKSKI